MFYRLVGGLVGAGLPTLVVTGFAEDAEKHGLGFGLSQESTACSCVAMLKKILLFLCNYSLGVGEIQQDLPGLSGGISFSFCNCSFEHKAIK